MQNRSIDDDAVSLEPLLRSRKGGHVAGGELEVELHSVNAPLVASDDVKTLDDEGDEEEKRCRVCFDSDNPEDMISPCLCSGGQKHIHRACLNEWRSQEQIPHAFTRCPTCHFEYVTRDVTRDATCAQKTRFYLLVGRDISFGCLVVYAAILSLSLGVMLCDSGHKSLFKMFPEAWAEQHKHFYTFGPYFVCGLVLFFAIVGLCGMAGRRIRIAPNPYVCSASEGCFGCLVAVIIMLAVTGLIFGIMQSFRIISQTMRKHSRVVWMRGEAQRIVVLDLEKNPGAIGERA